jgi:hypothetical protein
MMYSTDSKRARRNAELRKAEEQRKRAAAREGMARVAGAKR